MTGPNAAALASLAGWIDDMLGNEYNNRQLICENAAAQLRDMAAAVRESAPPAAASGPFAGERQAHEAALKLGGPPRPSWSILLAEQHRAMLAAACEAAGVEVGEYDSRILSWLAGWEDSTCAVVAGLIGRAHASGSGDADLLRAAVLAGAVTLDEAQLGTVLDALDDAVEYRRERGGEPCMACEAEYGGLCYDHAADEGRYDRYAATARQLRQEAGR